MRESVGEDRNERAADDEVLLDVPLLRPRNDVAPADDVHHRIFIDLRGAVDNHTPAFIAFLRRRR